MKYLTYIFLLCIITIINIIKGAPSMENEKKTKLIKLICNLSSLAMGIMAFIFLLILILTVTSPASIGKEYKYSLGSDEYNSKVEVVLTLEDESVATLVVIYKGQMESTHTLYKIRDGKLYEYNSSSSSSLTKVGIIDAYSLKVSTAYLDSWDYDFNMTLKCNSAITLTIVSIIFATIGVIGIFIPFVIKSKLVNKFTTKKEEPQNTEDSEIEMVD